MPFGRTWLPQLTLFLSVLCAIVFCSNLELVDYRNFGPKFEIPGVVLCVLWSLVLTLESLCLIGLLVWAAFGPERWWFRHFCGLCFVLIFAGTGFLIGAALAEERLYSAIEGLPTIPLIAVGWLVLALVLSSVRLWDSRWSLTNVGLERTSTRSRSRGSLLAAVAAVSVAGYLLFQWLEDILPNAVLAVFIDDIGLPGLAPDYPVLTMIGALTGTLLVVLHGEIWVFRILKSLAGWKRVVTNIVGLSLPFGLGVVPLVFLAATYSAGPREGFDVLVIIGAILGAVPLLLTLVAAVLILGPPCNWLVARKWRWTLLVLATVALLPAAIPCWCIRFSGWRLGRVISEVAPPNASVAAAATRRDRITEILLHPATLCLIASVALQVCFHQTTVVETIQTQIVRNRMEIFRSDGDFLDVPSDQRKVWREDNLADKYMTGSWLRAADPTVSFRLKVNLEESRYFDVKNLNQLSKVKSVTLALYGDAPLSIEHVKDIQNLHLLEIGSRNAPPEDLSLLASMTSVIQLIFHDTVMTGSDLSPIAGMKQLTFLQLTGGNLDDADMVDLSNCSRLQTLNLEGNNLTGKDLAGKLRGASIQSLDLDMNPLVPEVYDVIDSLPQLRTLMVGDLPLTSKAVEAAGKRPSLQGIYCGRLDTVKPVELARLLLQRPKLSLYGTFETAQGPLKTGSRSPDGVNHPVLTIGSLPYFAQKLKWKLEPLAKEDFDRPGSELTPENLAVINFYQGVWSSNAKDRDAAITSFTKAIRLNPDYAAPYYWRGGLFHKKGDDDNAIRDLAKVILLDPNFAGAFYSRGQIYFAKGDNDKAIRDFTKAILLQPKFVDAYFSRGNAYAKTGDQGKAEADFARAKEHSRKKVKAEAGAPQSKADKSPAQAAALKKLWAAIKQNEQGEVVEVLFHNRKLTDAGLVHLKGLANLQTLNLYDTKITGAGLVHLKDLTGLKTLNLRFTKITDAGLVHLKGLTNLQTLSLSNTQITDAGLVHLKGITKLRSLKIKGTKVTAEGIADLQQSLPNCKIYRK